MIVIDLSTAAGILTGTALAGFVVGHRFATRRREAADERALRMRVDIARELSGGPRTHRPARTVREATGEADRAAG